jgi:hypothetical protein
MQETNAKTNVAKRTTARTVAWCYTYNNPTAPIPFNVHQMLYHVYGDEVGESGTRHYQGFIVFKNRKLFTQVKELCPEAHWESTNGTYQQAADYCKKDSQFVEEGTLPEQPQKKGSKAGGKATKDKWRFISDSAKKGDLHLIDAEHPKQFVNSYRNLVAIRKDFTTRLPDLPGVCGVWYYGKPGVGKTRLCSLKYPNAYLKRMNKWFDGYNNEKVVVLDDFGLDHKFMGYELKKLADRYCYMVEVKNASMYIRPEICVVTSQYKIEDVWADDQETKNALQRRFVQVEITSGNIELAFAVANERLAIKRNIAPVPKPPSIPDEKMLDVQEITAEEFDSVMEKYNAKPVPLETIEKMPKKLRPTNKFFPERPIRFVPYNKKKFQPPRLARKDAHILIEEKKDEDSEVEEVEEILSSAPSTPEEISFEEGSSSDEEWHDGHGNNLEDYYDMYCQDESLEVAEEDEEEEMQSTPEVDYDDSE